MLLATPPFELINICQCISGIKPTQLSQDKRCVGGTDPNHFFIIEFVYINVFIIRFVLLTFVIIVFCILTKSLRASIASSYLFLMSQYFVPSKVPYPTTSTAWLGLRLEHMGSL